MLPQINAIVRRYASAVDFAGVYILEAHASDEWPISEAPRSFTQVRAVHCIHAPLGFIIHCMDD